MRSLMTRFAARPRPMLIAALLVLSAGACATRAGGEDSRAPRLPEAKMTSGSSGLDLGSSTEEMNLSIEVMVDSAGRPDMRTLRVTGPGAMQTQAGVAAWI